MIPVLTRLALPVLGFDSMRTPTNTADTKPSSIVGERNVQSKQLFLFVDVKPIIHDFYEK